MSQGAEQTHISILTAPAASHILRELNAFVADDLERVNRLMMTEMQSPVPLIPQLAGHLVAAGGKRIRPLVTLLAARLFVPVPDKERLCRLAACVEFIHAATLLHDDVVDESILRRGTTTANKIWGNKASVLVGDFLFSRAFQLMVCDGSLPVLELLSRTASVIAEGEVLQQMTTGDPTVTEDDYFKVATAKTAPLFAAAAQVAALVGYRPQQEQEALAEYGRLLGITFQLIDDLLDYTSSGEQMGKNLGDDFREGKITLPIIYAYQKGTELEQAFWRRTLTDLDQKESDLAQALIYLKKHKALDYTFDCAKASATRAKQALNCFSASLARIYLEKLADFALERLY
jgi:octaprenyl-diphosphate synthase